MCSTNDGGRQAKPSGDRSELLAELRASFDEKVRRGIFKPLARLAPPGDEGAERLQDAICQTWETYRRLALEKGHVLSDAVLVHHCHLRIIDLGRRFVHGDHLHRNDDVYAAFARTNGKAELVRVADDDRLGQTPEGGAALTGGLVSSLDIRAWTDSLTELDCRVLYGRLVGETFTETAARVGMSRVAVFRRVHALGETLASQVGVVIKASKAPHPFQPTATP